MKGHKGPQALTSKARVLERIWVYGFEIKSVSIKYESPPNFVLIKHKCSTTPYDGSPKSCQHLFDLKCLIIMSTLARFERPLTLE